MTLTLGDPPVCGDGAVTGNEQCDTAIASGNSGACPTSCSTSYCTTYSLVEGGTCGAHCVASGSISACLDGDSCCPETCTALNDDYCPEGWLPCTSDSSCPADRYCDLSRATPVCKAGCRLNSPGTCTSDHHCAPDHRCVLSNVVPHQRCAACSDGNPCDQGYECTLFINLCAPACFIMLDECATLVGPDEMCLLTFCSMGDCP